jgi:hypothetical protein
MRIFYLLHTAIPLWPVPGGHTQICHVTARHGLSRLRGFYEHDDDYDDDDDDDDADDDDSDDAGFVRASVCPISSTEFL